MAPHDITLPDSSRPDSTSEALVEIAVPHRTVPGEFARQVARAPSATAVVSGGVTLTYAGLDARANRLANRLVSAGVRVDQPVGLLMARSVDVVVAELAIVKAGGAYLPLDLRAPAERVRRVL